VDVCFNPLNEVGLNRTHSLSDVSARPQTRSSAPVTGGETFSAAPNKSTINVGWLVGNNDRSDKVDVIKAIPSSLHKCEASF
jgi:hypothetical protein